MALVFCGGTDGLQIFMCFIFLQARSSILNMNFFKTSFLGALKKSFWELFWENTEIMY